jgi:hypothetical protein
VNWQLRVGSSVELFKRGTIVELAVDKSSVAGYSLDSNDMNGSERHCRLQKI